jgi:hypothetical protein
MESSTDRLEDACSSDRLRNFAVSRHSHSRISKSGNRIVAHRLPTAIRDQFK